MNQSEIMRSHCIQQLEAMNLTYPGYPENRYLYVGEQNLTIPEGPWDTEQSFPNTSVTQDLEAAGYQTDELGRPLHPWFKEIASSVGMVAGRGAYWRWGPNKTGDAIIISQQSESKIALIQRPDNKHWAIPGGFVDDGESSGIVAARRESFEEIGLTLLQTPDAVIYEGVVADMRTTAHAWAETTAGLWVLDETEELKTTEETLDVGWFPIVELPQPLHGSHQQIIKFAVEWLLKHD